MGENYLLAAIAALAGTVAALFWHYDKRIREKEAECSTERESRWALMRQWREEDVKHRAEVIALLRDVTKREARS